jgi:hypothetical protein
MRTASEVNNLYFNFLDSISNMGKELILLDTMFYNSSIPYVELETASHLLMCFEDSWNYLDDETKEIICDLIGTFLINKSWE